MTFLSASVCCGGTSTRFPGDEGGDVVFSSIVQLEVISLVASWQTDHKAIIAIGLIAALQAGLIIALLAARRRNRRIMGSLNLAAEAADVGLWRREPNSEKLFVSSQLRKIMGLPSSGPVDLSFVQERLYPEDRERVSEAIERAAVSGSEFSLEHRIVTPDGTVRWVESHGRAVPGVTSQGYGTHGALIDITNRHESLAREEEQKKELAHLSRVSSLGVLSGAIAHELNQPLGIILSNAQAAEYLLESEQPDLEELRAIVSDIIEEDTRAGNVIKRLRSLLRRGDKAQERVDVNGSIRDTLRIMKSEIIRREITLKESLDPSLPDIMIESVHLQQVLINLTLNACDAMEAKDPLERRLEIGSCMDQEDVRILVNDRGMGLPEDPEQLFRPFHSSKSDGLGLGLSICRTLINAHGGRLWAEPNRDGGATFVISLPKAPDPS